MIRILALVSTLGAASPPAAEKVQLQCLGNEPFWSLKLQQRVITIEDMNGRGRSFTRSKPVAVGNRLGTWVFPGKSKKGQLMTLVVRTRDCSDGMSERIYPYEVMVIEGAQAFDGCCVPLGTDLTKCKEAGRCPAWRNASPEVPLDR